MCRQICLRYDIKREFGKSPFAQGAKYCQLCGKLGHEGIYIKWEGLFCPCCRYKLRTSPRHKPRVNSKKCIECTSTISMRGQLLMWFKDKEENDVCWKCWFKIHKAVCVDCGKVGKLIIGEREFIIPEKDNILCSLCHKIKYYQKLKEKRDKSKKLENKPITTTFF